MPEHNLETLLEEAMHVANDYPTVASGVDNSLHEYLRYAVLRLLEGDADQHSPTVDVTVGYGRDAAMADNWRSMVSWWSEMPVQEDCTRFRVFYPEDVAHVPRAISGVMGALGAWRVWSGDAVDVGAYDHRGRREVHYCWPLGHPVEDRLDERLDRNTQAVATDGGCAGDVRAREAVSDQAQTGGLEARTQRALDEEMAISLLAKGGQYEVRSASGSIYDVGIIAETCTCPDYQQREPDGGCKHLRRVDYEIKHGRVPRPDGRLPETPR